MNSILYYKQSSFLRLGFPIPFFPPYREYVWDHILFLSPTVRYGNPTLIQVSGYRVFCHKHFDLSPYALHYKEFRKWVHTVGIAVNQVYFEMFNDKKWIGLVAWRGLKIINFISLHFTESFLFY